MTSSALAEDYLIKTMNENKEYLTKEKFDEFKKELEYLKHDRRKEVAENLEYAKSLGDLSENAEYHEARDMQANIEDRISHLEELLKSAEILPSSHDTNVVTIGSVVSVLKQDESKNRIYTIVGTEEADMASGKVSIKSPIGHALLGKKKKDVVEVSTPKGMVTYKVVDIQ